MNLKTYAAIDIGSNAGRMLVGHILPSNDHHYVRKLSLTRVPIRLGDDVFEKGRISDKKIKLLVKAFKAFKHLMDIYKVDEYRACATSAMREADNSKEVVAKIKKESGIELELISGSKEADLIFSTLPTQKLDVSLNYLFIDVGGGSTELTIIKDGVRVKSKSFEIGSVRSLKGKVNDEIFEDIGKWIEGKMEDDEYYGIGTGGNINNIYKQSGLSYMEPLKMDKFLEIYTSIKEMSEEDRMNKLRMKPDRVDVIVPASKIYLHIMKMAGIKAIYVPKLGLADGMIYTMHLDQQ